ncbi:DUF6665 family protein [Henriciella aquimarina]|uniref:DUF6665 family protein n=1 Tax=Henriciella aquimarina TaxID=545261 RepID=UPI0009FEA7A1|nr:DUF6665 family protein [Henriciella aquimarina]
MSLRPPRQAFNRAQAAEAKSPLDTEIAAEKAAALGRAGRALEDAMARLEEDDADIDREALLLTAAEKVQAYFLIRELNGLRDQREIIRAYGIPRQVLNRIGIISQR